MCIIRALAQNAGFLMKIARSITYSKGIVVIVVIVVAILVVE